MKRSVKTILMGTVALMAGVGLASAQGMRDVPSSAGDRGASSGSSSQMTPGASGSHREMNGKQGKTEKSEKSETRGQAQRGPSDKDMSKGRKKRAPERLRQRPSQRQAEGKSSGLQKSLRKNRPRARPPRTQRTGRYQELRQQEGRDNGSGFEGQDREVDNGSGLVRHQSLVRQQGPRHQGLV
jgi:hypothetical protein